MIVLIVLFGGIDVMLWYGCVIFICVYVRLFFSG